MDGEKTVLNPLNYKRKTLSRNLNDDETFQNDRAPCHKTHSTKKYATDKNVTVLKIYTITKTGYKSYRANIDRMKEKSSSQEHA